MVVVMTFLDDGEGVDEWDEDIDDDIDDGLLIVAVVITVVGGEGGDAGDAGEGLINVVVVDVEFDDDDDEDEDELTFDVNDLMSQRLMVCLDPLNDKSNAVSFKLELEVNRGIKIG